MKTFMEIDFTYSPGPNVVWMRRRYRASDGAVVWSDAYRSDATMTALLRTGRHIPTRAERAAELEQKINRARTTDTRFARRRADRLHRPTGDIAGAQASLRFHEKFGENMSSLFGHDRRHLHDRPAERGQESAAR